MVLLVPGQDLDHLDLAVREHRDALAQHVHVLDVREVLPAAFLHRRQEEERAAVFRVDRLRVDLQPRLVCRLLRVGLKVKVSRLISVLIYRGKF